MQKLSGCCIKVEELEPERVDNEIDHSEQAADAARGALRVSDAAPPSTLCEGKVLLQLDLRHREQVFAAVGAAMRKGDELVGGGAGDELAAGLDRHQVGHILEVRARGLLQQAGGGGLLQLDVADRLQLHRGRHPPVKILGGSIVDSQLLKGMLVTPTPKSACTYKESGTKVSVSTCSLDATQMETETKGTVLLRSDELMNYNHSEAIHPQRLHEIGVDVVIDGQRAVPR